MSPECQSGAPQRKVWHVCEEDERRDDENARELILGAFYFWPSHKSHNHENKKNKKKLKIGFYFKDLTELCIKKKKMPTQLEAQTNQRRLCFAYSAALYLTLL